MRIPNLALNTSFKPHPDTSVVVVTLYGGDDLWARAFESVLRYTPDEVPICIFEDRFPNSEAIEIAHSIYAEHGSGKLVFLHRNKTNLGVVANLNLAFQLLTPANVVVLNSDVIVGENWLRGLEAGLQDPTVATVTALSTNSTIFTVPAASILLGSNPSIAEVNNVAQKIWNSVNPNFPEVPTTVSCCALFRRRAFEVAGYLDEFFSPGYGEETDFSLRCIEYGFRHVAAENVVVYHEGGVSFGATKQISVRKENNDREVLKRYPYLKNVVRDLELNQNHPLNVAIRFNDAILGGLNILIDGTLINENHTGTFVGALGLIQGISNNQAVNQVTITVSADRIRSMRNLFKKFSIKVQVMSFHQMQEGEFDIGLIPHQAYNPQVFDWMKDHVQRRLIWHLDFIATSIPGYHRDSRVYFESIANLQRTIAVSDGILFLTADAVALAQSKGLNIDKSRVYVVPAAPDINLKVRKDSFLKVGDLGNYILVLGVGYKHKNREYVMRAFNSVKEELAEVNLVFAGPEPTLGSDDIVLNDSVIDLGRVTDSERSSLIKNAKLVISASIVEGFGLAPLEAAALGSVPLVTKTFGYQSHGWAPYWIDLDDTQKFKSTLLELITNDNSRLAQLKSWEENVKRYSWDTSADAFISASFDCLSKPQRNHEGFNLEELKINWKGQIAQIVLKSGLFPVGSIQRSFLRSNLEKYRKFFK
jgi:glycosyltransferase involved in cell wall biosynthesis